MLSKLLNPKFKIFIDSLDLEFLVLNPLPTDIILRSFNFTEAAKGRAIERAQANR